MTLAWDPPHDASSEENVALNTFLNRACPTCRGRCMIATYGPDENGQYDTEGCPDCA